MPSVGSGRYSPGPSMVYLLVEVYQVIRTPLAICSLIRPGNPAIDSTFEGLFRLGDLDRAPRILLGLLRREPGDCCCPVRPLPRDAEHKPVGEGEPPPAQDV